MKDTNLNSSNKTISAVVAIAFAILLLFGCTPKVIVEYKYMPFQECVPDTVIDVRHHTIWMVRDSCY